MASCIADFSFEHFSATTIPLTSALAFASFRMVDLSASRRAFRSIVPGEVHPQVERLHPQPSPAAHEDPALAVAARRFRRAIGPGSRTLALSDPPPATPPYPGGVNVIDSPMPPVGASTNINHTTAV